jgi:hypothetical protein
MGPILGFWETPAPFQPERLGEFPQALKGVPVVPRHHPVDEGQEVEGRGAAVCAVSSALFAFVTVRPSGCLAHGFSLHRHGGPGWVRPWA